MAILCSRGHVQAQRPYVQSSRYKDKIYRYERYSCGQCQKIYRANHIEMVRANSRDCNKRKHTWLEIVKNVPCKDCQKRYPSCIMDFDHTGVKKFNIGQDYTRMSWAKLEAEVKECEVVCSNCHRLRTYARSHA